VYRQAAVRCPRRVLCCSNRAPGACIPVSLIWCQKQGDTAIVCSQSEGCGRGLACYISKICSAVFKGRITKFAEALNRDINLWAPYWNSERSAHNFEFRLVAYSLTDTFLYIRAGQLEPTEGPHNSLRTGLRAALVYTLSKWGGLNSLERRYLLSVS
jgi:hypothetical protein